MVLLVLLLALACLSLCAGFAARGRSGDPLPSSGLRVAGGSLPDRVKSLDAQLGRLYTSALSVKCPFFRRRSFDLLDAASSVFRFVLARHKSLDVPGLQCVDDFATTAEAKRTGLPLSELEALIRHDWRADDGFKGYYITGRLSREVYSDHCFFDGPDPDMPVRGLRKYQASASQLFERKSSTAELLSLSVDEDSRVLTARWRIQGKLNLPWHPSVKPWTGTTRYVVNSEGLVQQHLEEWDIGVADAFFSTLFPALQIGAPPSPPSLVP